MKTPNINLIPTGLDPANPEHWNQVVKILNQNIQTLQNNVNTITQVGAKSPNPVSGVSAQGKQGMFSLTWNRMNNVDGYVILQANDAAMTQITNRYTIPDGQQCSYTIAVGNQAQTSHFQIFAYQGPRYSKPSNGVSATSVVFGTSTDSAPKTPPLAPLSPLIKPVRSGPNLP